VVRSRGHRAGGRRGFWGAGAGVTVGVALLVATSGANSAGAPPKRERVTPPTSLTKRYPLGRDRLCCASGGSAKTRSTPASKSAAPPNARAKPDAAAKPATSATPAPGAKTAPTAATSRPRASETSDALMIILLAAGVPLLVLAGGLSVRHRRRRIRHRRRAYRAERSAAFKQAVESSHARHGASARPRPARVPAAQVAETLAALPAALPVAPADEMPSAEDAFAVEHFDGGTAGPEPAPATAVRALGYISVPGSQGDQDNLDARAQIAAIEKECERRGFVLEKLVHDAEPNDGGGTGRPGLSYALDRLARGEASVLVVSSLERLSRSIVELGAVFEWFVHSDASLIVVDHALDTTDPAGRLVAQVVISMSGWERNRLADRTRRGLDAARSKGQVSRPAVSDIPALKNRIVAMREDGMTLQAIADHLNQEGVPTLRGGSQWRPSSVQSAAGYKRPKRSRSGVDLPPPRQPNHKGDDT
jgi:DNA invertase Pin-like site-specific DNA recombinase